MPEQRRLAGAVGADDADDAAGRQRERQIVDQQPVAVALAQLLRPRPPRRRGAAPAGSRSRPFRAAALLFLAAQRLVGADARLALGLPRARRHADPLELALQRPLARRRLLLLAAQPLALLVEPGRVVPLERNAAPAIELEDPAGDVVEEVAIVRHRHHRAGVLLRGSARARRRTLGVEVVGRLVEQQQVGLLQQQPAERHAPAFAAGERRDVGVAGGRRSASMAISSVRSSSQALAASIRSCSFACCSSSAVHRVVVHRLAELGRDRFEVVRAARAFRPRPPRRCRARPSTRRAAAPAAGSRRGRPAVGLASPMNSVSTPAMMRSSVLLPAPLGPRTPILAPGKKARVMSSSSTRSGAIALRSLYIV